MNIVRIAIAALIGFSLLLPLWSSSPAEAAVSQNVTVIATPDIGGGITDFTIIYISDTELNFTWAYDGDAVNAMIRAKYNAAPDDIPDQDTEPSDGYLVYYGSGTSAEDTSMNLDLNTGPIHYMIWGQKADTKWFINSLTDNMEGIAMTLIALILIPLGLTIAMFHTKNSMLGMPAALFWAVLGGYAYTLSTTPWGDWQFFLAFASLLGMVTFTSLAAFGLREKRDSLGDESLSGSEGDTDTLGLFAEDNEFDGERNRSRSRRRPQPFEEEELVGISPRVADLRARAKQRRGRRSRGTTSSNWGAFS